MTVRILLGDCRERLRELPAESVHCVVTSPPYWGLRDYGLPPTIWGGASECDHIWGGAMRRHKGGPSGNGVMLAGGRSVVQAQTAVKDIDAGAGCARCGAWRGQLGLEPTYQMYVEHIVEVFREIWRVLRHDGTCWLNLGDCYATGAYAVGSAPGGGAQGRRWAGASPERGERSRALRDGAHAGKHTAMVAIGPMTQPNRLPQPGLKPKDLCMIPARVAIALQEDGWWARQDIIWSKPSPMPESTTDRCTKAHEFMFHLAKAERYFYDAEAIAEPATGRAPGNQSHKHTAQYESEASEQHRIKAGLLALGARERRNKRSVWTVAAEPFMEAHFAVFPSDLVKPCILAGTSERGVCPTCGAPWRRVTARETEHRSNAAQAGTSEIGGKGHVSDQIRPGHDVRLGPVSIVRTVGWYPTCRCDRLPSLPGYPRRRQCADEESWRAARAAVDAARESLCTAATKLPTQPATVLDPFGGAGTVGLVAERHRRHAILIELSPRYAAMAERRIRADAPLFAEVAE